MEDDDKRFHGSSPTTPPSTTAVQHFLVWQVYNNIFIFSENLYIYLKQKTQHSE